MRTSSALLPLLITALMVMLTLPIRAQVYTAREVSNLEFASGFQPEDGDTYAALGPQATLRFLYFPRYTDLHLRLWLSYTRATASITDASKRSDVAPITVSIYETTIQVHSVPSTLNMPQHPPPSNLVGIIDANNLNAGKEFVFDIPARSSGQGVLVIIQTNYPSEVSDGQLRFLRAELSLPTYHVLRLIFPYPFLIAMFVILVGLRRWAMRCNLQPLETLLFLGLSAFALTTLAPVMYEHSTPLLILALAFTLLLEISGRPLNPAYRRVFFGTASALFVVIFLFSSTADLYDINYYLTIAARLRENGLWNIYNYYQATNPINITIGYPPLITYQLMLYNLLTTPFGLEYNALAWRIAGSAVFLMLIGLIYLLSRSQIRSSPGVQMVIGLMAFNPAIFYNPTVWGNSDILTTCLLVCAFILICRRRFVLGGIMLMVCVIDKQTAWYILPVLGWMLLSLAGIKRGIIALICGTIVIAVMAAVPFGFDASILRKLFQNPEFTGSFTNSVMATNLTYLVLGFEQLPYPSALIIFEFVLMGGIMSIVFIMLLRRDRTRSDRYVLAAALVGLAAFVLLPKGKPRYLIYGLTFLGIASLSDKKLVKPFLILSWVQLFQLTMILGFPQIYFVPSLNQQVPYLWFALQSDGNWWGLQSLTSIITIGYVLWIYIGASKQAIPSPKMR